MTQGSIHPHSSDIVSDITHPVISVAPMLDWTDRHCRYFLRLLAPDIWLYTEMITTGALLFGDKDRHLRFDPSEQPVALQLGGSDPDALALCARMGEDYGYQEVNLNCGCPSDRVQNGSFGACLMKTPHIVADCIEAMQKSVNIPVTVKCRIGVDDCDEIPFLTDFIKIVRETGCRHFIIHARKAWLKGLSPKENREIPPLRYDIASLIRETWPDLHITLNGGIKDSAQIKTLLPQFDGLMIGREAYSNPYFLSEIENEHFNRPLPDREEIALAMIPYIERQQRDYGTPVKSVTRHMLGLYQGQRGGRAWRRVLSTEAYKPDITAAGLIHTALAATRGADRHSGQA